MTALFFTKPISLFFLLLITGSFPIWNSVKAEPEETHGQVLFILDASGSMWGRVEGKEKIVVAREVMTNLVKELPEQIEVGLQAYGHRNKGDCNDIEVLVPVGGDKEHVIQEIQSINPKGKTPITKSFKIAGERLKDIEEETTVVLISDGEETCGGDPCTLVSSLRDQGINVRVHVVGFDVNMVQREQLICIADAGGGRYFSADNAGELATAFQDVKAELIKADSATDIAVLGATWIGSGWGTVVLSRTEANSYEGTYTDTYGGVGRLRLSFTRLTGRGRWWEERKGDERRRGGNLYEIEVSPQDGTITGKWNTTNHDYGPFVKEASFTWKKQ